MALTDINRKNDSEQNEFCNAPFDFSSFVEGHKATMDYLYKFGSPVDKAKVSILFEMAGVKL
jgi:hypothetical protein